MTLYLAKADVLALAEGVLPSVRMRDAGQLHAAVLRPQTTAFGAEAYPTIWHKAAALLQSLIIGHPLIDGNKRLGWAATAFFLHLNGETLGHSDVDAAYALVIAVTTGELDDVEEIAQALRKLP
ncbi:type II toxin-antitoxin system death-on-curing family toxin [Nonomuraea sp. NPDC059194]|uniref:type II toxin-antitoxin system death-on-curing family toxin n=1 Tax=Nonomuraea sp. NPDC059194 TaxID=3346764 RepID=UPI003680ED53